MKSLVYLLVSLLLSGAVLSQTPTGHDHVACPRCAWRARSGGRVVDVKSADELHRAVAQARPGDTILLADGRYALQRVVEIVTPNVTLRSRSGRAARSSARW